MLPLSAIVTTYNEEPNIRAALESIAWVPDILVVDSFSEDRTTEIARAFTDRVVQRPYHSPADQKNWAIPKARHPWVLLIDADERVPPALREEIEDLLQSEPPQDAYWIRRRSYFRDRRIQYSGWQGDAVVRLFRRDLCRYEPKLVHEEIITRGLRTGRLSARLDHFTFRNTAQFLEKIHRYAKASAIEQEPETGPIGFFHLFVKPAARFAKHYLLKRGYADGRAGLIISAIMAWGVFLRYTFMLDARSTLHQTSSSKKTDL